MILFWIFIIFKLFKTVPIYFLCYYFFFLYCEIYIYIYKAQGNYIYTCIKERDIKNTLSIEYNLNKKHNDNQKLFFTSLHTIIF